MIATVESNSSRLALFRERHEAHRFGQYVAFWITPRTTKLSKLIDLPPSLVPAHIKLLRQRELPGLLFLRSQMNVGDAQLRVAYPHTVVVRLAGPVAPFACWFNGGAPVHHAQMREFTRLGEAETCRYHALPEHPSNAWRALAQLLQGQSVLVIDSDLAQRLIGENWDRDVARALVASRTAQGDAELIDLRKVQLDVHALGATERSEPRLAEAGRQQATFFLLALAVAGAVAASFRKVVYLQLAMCRLGGAGRWYIRRWALAAAACVTLGLCAAAILPILAWLSIRVYTLAGARALSLEAAHLIPGAMLLGLVIGSVLCLQLLTFRALRHPLRNSIQLGFT